MKRGNSAISASALGALLATFSIPLEEHVEAWAPDGVGPA